MAKEVILTEQEVMDNALLNRAIAYAVEMHKDGLRKGTNIPYIMHPLEVMRLLSEMGADKKLMAAGVLHDTVEDTEATIEDIANLFGQEVADLVASHTEKDKSLPWRERKEIALEHLRKASRREQMLVLADKLANISDMAKDYDKLKHKLWERFNQGRKEQEWYYREAVKVLSPLKKDDKLVDFYERFANIVDYVFGGKYFAECFYELLEGLLDEERVEQSIKSLEHLAESKFVGAMIALAEAYQGIPTVPEDLEKSFAWWQKAAELNHPAGLYNLGKCYENGKGTAEDMYEAVGLYLKAAEYDYSPALNELGICCAEGIVLDKNSQEAFNWFAKASEKEDYAGALYNLARCYATGFGTEVNLEEAERVTQLANDLYEKQEDAYEWVMATEGGEEIKIYN